MLNVITKEDELLQTLQALFGGQFKKRYESIDAQAMILIVRGALMNLTEDQFRQGMARLYGSRFCPDIAEFRSWCVSGSWWTVNEAWQRACDYSNLSDFEVARIAQMSEKEFKECKTKITVLAKKAWDSVSWLVNQGDMKGAFIQFKALYDDYIAKAQTLGRHQEWYVPAKAIGIKDQVNIAKPKGFLSQITLEQKAITDLTMQLMSDGMKWGDALKKAQFEVTGKEQSVKGFKGLGGGV